MSTTSIKPVPTLKGIFSVPKTNHRRDFLRENKLNLRELQRVTTNKLKANQPQDQFKHNKQQQTTHQQQHQQQQQQQQNLANRRSASQARIPAQKPPARSLSQQRPPPAEPRQNRQPSRCSSVCSVNNRVGDGVRRGSNTTVVSKTISCDKQIQTEDINDEEFLYRALKRCTGGESNGHSSTKLNSNVANQRQSHSDLPHMPHHSSYITNGEDCHDDCFQPVEQQEQQQQTEHYQQQQLNYHQQDVNYQQQQQPNYQQQQQSNYPQQYPNYQQQQSNYNHQQQQSNYNQQQYEKPHENYQQLELDCDVQQDTQRTRNSYNPNNINNNNNNNNNHNNNNIIMDNEEAFHNSARITTRPSQRSHHSQHSIRSQNSHQSQQSHHSIRSHHSINSQHSQRSQQHMNVGQQQVKANVEDMELNLDNLAIDGQQHGDQLHQAQQSNQQLPLSGHSRVTVASTHSHELTKKKSNGSVHKLGSRDDVRLPRYLEREKREREEQRLREVVRDPNCPFGHFALTEDERLAALATAQKKFQTLINELNHMPMTTQTLRIRTRKGEIEKELATLEADIRIFSKSKVYIKKPEEPVE